MPKTKCQICLKNVSISYKDFHQRWHERKEKNLGTKNIKENIETLNIESDPDVGLMIDEDVVMID